MLIISYKTDNVTSLMISVIKFYITKMSIDQRHKQQFVTEVARRTMKQFFFRKLFGATWKCIAIGIEFMYSEAVARAKVWRCADLKLIRKPILIPFATIYSLFCRVRFWAERADHFIIHFGWMRQVVSWTSSNNFILIEGHGRHGGHGYGIS